MPTKRTPSLRHHKHTDRAYVVLDGRYFYTGKWGMPEAEQGYYALLAEHKALGFVKPRVDLNQITVAEVLATYYEHAKRYYTNQDGKPTKQLTRVKPALNAAADLYGAMAAVDFGPRCLAAVRQTLVDHPYCRVTANAMIRCIKLAFKWAGEQELVPGSVWVNLSTLSDLKRGRTQAKEADPITPVPLAHVEKLLPKLTPTLAAMVQVQLLTGARPGEIVGLRPCDIEQSGQVWTANLLRHKTAHRGKQRILLFGPQAQTILKPFLLRPEDVPIFSPRESRRAARPSLKGKPRRPNQKPSPTKTKKTVGLRYTVESYGRAIRRACVTHDVPSWSPNRLRHTRATFLRSKYGLEATQVILGHATADVTQVYAEADLARAIAVMREVG